MLLRKWPLLTDIWCINDFAPPPCAQITPLTFVRWSAEILGVSRKPSRHFTSTRFSTLFHPVIVEIQSLHLARRQVMENTTLIFSWKSRGWLFLEGLPILHLMEICPSKDSSTCQESQEVSFMENSINRHYALSPIFGTPAPRNDMADFWYTEPN